MKKRELIAEVVRCVAFAAMLFVFIWIYCQAADPLHYSLFAQIPCSVAFLSLIIMIIGIIVEEILRSRYYWILYPDQEVRKIKNKNWSRRIYYDRS